MRASEIKMFVTNKRIESELLFAVINLSAKVLKITIGEINEDWYLNEDDEIHEDFDTILSHIIYNDYVSEPVMQQLGINGTSDLIEFYEVYEDHC